MNLARVSINGQITVPVEIRRLLKLKEGDKMLFIQKDNGEVIVGNAATTALKKAQEAFAGSAKDFGVKNEDDVQRMVDEMRYGKKHEDYGGHKFIIFDIIISRFNSFKSIVPCL